MKKTLILLFILQAFFSQAKPRNLYEQLCEINQEWFKNKAIAKELGFLSMKPIEDEQEILSFHIHTLEKIFSQRGNPNLSEAQKANRSRNIQVLNEYWKRYDCPRNYYLPYRNPVFIDHEGRYCAVAYLMLKSGKKDFCEAVQKSNNFIFIRQIESEEFNEWQKESGLSLDELAWIQPGYMAMYNFARWKKLDKKGIPIELDRSTADVMGLRFREKHPDFPKDDADTTFQTESGINNRIFWNLRMNGKIAAKTISYQGDADFSTFEKKMKNGDYDYSIKNISAITLYKNELYLAIDSTLYTQNNDSTLTSTHYSYILKWDSDKKTWNILNAYINGPVVYSFFEVNGELYAGGGHYQQEVCLSGTEEEIGNEYINSFMAKLEDHHFKEDPIEYWGFVVGMVNKDNKKYVVTVNDVFGGFNNHRLPMVFGIELIHEKEYHFAKWKKFDAKGMAVELDSAATANMYRHYAKTQPGASPNLADTSFQVGSLLRNRIFHNIRMSGELAAQSIHYNGEADLSAFCTLGYRSTGETYWKDHISAITLYHEELYVAIDSTQNYYDQDSNQISTHYAYILKWDSDSKRWKTLNRFEDGPTIFCFFETEGELYAGGGQSLKEEGEWVSYVDSYLAKLGNGHFEEDPNEYWGFVCGLVTKNNKKYLGIVLDTLNTSRFPSFIKELQENSTEGGK